MHELLFAHGVVRRIQDHEQLHQFGRLQVEHLEREPALGAVDALADTGHQHQRQQYQRAGEQVRRPALPGFHAHAESQQTGHQRDADEDRLALQKVRIFVVGEFRRIGQGNRGRIYHHHAEQHQQYHNPHQWLIVFHHLRALHEAVRLARRRTARE